MSKIFFKEVSPAQAAEFANPELSALLVDLSDRSNRHVWVLTDPDLGELAIGGIFISRPGLGECWISLVDDRVSGYRRTKALSVGAAAFLDWAAKEYGLSRVQCTCVKGHLSAYRFAEALGFECEGELRHYDSAGRNHLLFSKIYA